MNNQKKPSSMKGTIAVIAIVIILVGGWYFYEKGSSPSSSSSSTLTASSPSGAAAGTSDVGANVLSILQSVSSIKIDTAFFSSPVYQSLVDYSITVPPEPVGRTDPFAPVAQ